MSLDSIVANELGDPEKLQCPEFAVSKSKSSSGSSPYDAGSDDDDNNEASTTEAPKKKTSPRLLNLQYDLTPIKFVGMVVTEAGLIPPTAVPALLREIRKEAGDVLASDL